MEIYDETKGKKRRKISYWEYLTNDDMKTTTMIFGSSPTKKKSAPREEDQKNEK